MQASISMGLSLERLGCPLDHQAQSPLSPISAASRRDCGLSARAACTGHLRPLRRGSFGEVLMARATCCAARRDVANATAWARRSRSQDGVGYRCQCVSGRAT